jgi:hypothetical protein
LNKQRRAELDKAIALIQTARENFDEAIGIIQECASEEREGFDNLSEGLQATERGQSMEAAADSLDEAVGELEGLDFDTIEDLIGAAMGE